MLIGVDQAPSPDADEDQYGAGPTEDVDPSTLAPLCGEAEFNELVDELVADEAPRLFAVMQVYGERVDGRIAAWGMAFEDHADVVGVDGGAWMGLPTPERAVRMFARRRHITARLVWVNPDAASPADETDAT